jgi:hypothetical protein
MVAYAVLSSPPTLQCLRAFSALTTAKNVRLSLRSAAIETPPGYSTLMPDSRRTTLLGSSAPGTTALPTTGYRFLGTLFFLQFFSWSFFTDYLALAHNALPDRALLTLPLLVSARYTARHPHFSALTPSAMGLHTIHLSSAWAPYTKGESLTSSKQRTTPVRSKVFYSFFVHLCISDGFQVVIKPLKEAKFLTTWQEILDYQGAFLFLAYISALSPPSRTAATRH